MYLKMWTEKYKQIKHNLINQNKCFKLQSGNTVSTESVQFNETLPSLSYGEMSR